MKPRTVLAFLALAALFALVGTWDFADALTDEAIAKEELALRAAQLADCCAHPLPYTATVRDCLPSGRECTRERYYVPRSARRTRACVSASARSPSRRFLIGAEIATQQRDISITRTRGRREEYREEIDGAPAQLPVATGNADVYGFGGVDYHPTRNDARFTLELVFVSKARAIEMCKDLGVWGGRTPKSEAGCAIFYPDRQPIPHCRVIVPEPVDTDDAATAVIGHEVLHCAKGRYHDE